MSAYIGSSAKAGVIVHLICKALRNVCIKRYINVIYYYFYLKCNFFQGFIYTFISKTVIACRDMQLEFFEVETLLKSVFNWSLVIIVPLSVQHDAPVDIPRDLPDHYRVHGGTYLQELCSAADSKFLPC